MKTIYAITLLILFTELFALVNVFAAAIIYSAWILIVLMLMLYGKIREKEMVIALMTFPVLRMLQFFSPVSLSTNIHVLLVYSALFIASLMHAKSMHINLKEIHSFRGIGYILLFIPLAFTVSLIANSQPVFTEFSKFNVFIIIFAAYTQALYFFGILQNKLHDKYYFLIIPLLASLPFLLQPFTAVQAFIIMLAFSLFFSKTKNIMPAFLSFAVIALLQLKPII